MPAPELHPEFLRKNGRNEFVVLPYDEFLQLPGELEELADIRALDEARAREGHLPGVPLSEVRRRLNEKFNKPRRTRNSSELKRTRRRP